jgi:hypothetical protein
MTTELCIEDIELGMAVEKTVELKSDNPIYNGKSVRVRALRGKEFRQISQRSKVISGDIASNFILALEACKVAIITPGIASKIDDVDNDIILQLGEAILAVSGANEEEIEDFSTAPEGK